MPQPRAPREPEQLPSQPAAAPPTVSQVASGSVAATAAPGAGLAAGGVAGAGLTAATVTGAIVAGAVGEAAVAKGAKAIVDALAAFFKRKRDDDFLLLRTSIEKTYPAVATPAELDSLVRHELDREAEFQSKMLARWRMAMPRILSLKPEQRPEAMRKFYAREKKLLAAREKAMTERAAAAMERRMLKALSPAGAYWKLSPHVRAHTLDCLAVGEQFHPWSFLDKVHPPVHHGCPCTLIGLPEALGRGLMTVSDVPSDPAAAARKAMDAFRKAEGLMEEMTSEENRSIAAYLYLEEAYDDALHPRNRLGRWRKKLGKPRLDLKADKKLTTPGVHSRAKKVAKAFIDFYGGDLPEVRREDEYLAAVGSMARYRHPEEKASGLLYGQRIAERAADPDLGVHEFRILAHEAAHALSGNKPGPLPGFAQTVEEGAAEVLSLWFWKHRGQEMDDRDASAVEGDDGKLRWTKGRQTLVHSSAYREETAEVIRRAASVVGQWDRDRIIDEVEEAMRADHNGRLRFRDASDPDFKLPHGTPDTPEGIISWLLDDGLEWQGDWGANPARAEKVQHTVGRLLEHYPIPFKGVRVRESEEFNQLGGKDRDHIYLSPKFMDDDYMDRWIADFRGVTVQDEPEDVVVHEFGHVLDGWALATDPKEYRATIAAFVNEPVTYEVAGKPVTVPRWKAGTNTEAISAYAGESPFEYTAEAFTDWFKHGVDAHPRSVELGRMLDAFVAAHTGAALQEAAIDWRDRLHPRDRLGRFRDTLRADVRDAARELVPRYPTRQASPATTAVPEGVDTEAVRQAQNGGVAGPREVSQARRAVEVAHPEVSPVGTGTGPGYVQALHAAGFSPTDYMVQGPEDAPPDGRVVTKWTHLHGHALTTSFDLNGQQVDATKWSPVVPEAQQPVGYSSMPPDDWRSWAREMWAYSADMRARYPEARSDLMSIRPDELTRDHGGFHLSDGTVGLGRDVLPTIEADSAARATGEPVPDSLRAEMVQTYKLSTHEINHTLNPSLTSYRAPWGMKLEEALTEEIARVEAVSIMAEHGRTDLLDWHAKHPDDDAVAGTYQGYRADLDTVLNGIGVPPEMRGEYMRALKFQVPPSERLRFLAEDLSDARGMTPVQAEEKLHAILDEQGPKYSEAAAQPNFQPILAVGAPTPDPVVLKTGAGPVSVGARVRWTMTNVRTGARTVREGTVEGYSTLRDDGKTHNYLKVKRLDGVVDHGVYAPLITDVLADAPEPEVGGVRAGDTIRYEYPDGVSEATVLRVISADPQHWAIEAMTGEDSLAPGRRVILTPGRVLRVTKPSDEAAGLPVRVGYYPEVTDDAEREAISHSVYDLQGTATDFKSLARQLALHEENEPDSGTKAHDTWVMRRTALSERLASMDDSIRSAQRRFADSLRMLPDAQRERIASDVEGRVTDIFRQHSPALGDMATDEWLDRQSRGEWEMRLKDDFMTMARARREAPTENLETYYSGMGDLPRVADGDGLWGAREFMAKKEGYPSVAARDEATDEKLRYLLHPTRSHLAIRVTDEAMANILHRGALANLHEPEVELENRDKESNQRVRHEWEQRVWNVDADDPSTFPIYGYMASEDEDVPNSPAGGFGRVKLRMRDHVRDRATFIYSDSNYHSIAAGSAIPRPVNAPASEAVPYNDTVHDITSLTPTRGVGMNPEPPPPRNLELEMRRIEQTEAEWRAAGEEPPGALQGARKSWEERYRQWVRREEEEGRYNRWAHGDFFEAQVFGGIRLNQDVESIIFLDPPDPSLYSALDESGIPWAIFPDTPVASPPLVRQDSPPVEQPNGFDTGVFFHVTTKPDAVAARGEVIPRADGAEAVHRFPVDDDAVYLWPNRSAAAAHVDYMVNRGNLEPTAIVPVYADQAQIEPDPEPLYNLMRNAQADAFRGEHKANELGYRALDDARFYPDPVNQPQGETLREYLATKVDPVWSASGPSDDYPEHIKHDPWIEAKRAIRLMPKELRRAVARVFAEDGLALVARGPRPIAEDWKHFEAEAERALRGRAPSGHHVQEAAYEANLHPRDRLGKWVRGLGFKTYRVGGAVRDPLMGKNPDDVDFMVMAHPEAIKKAVAKTDARTIDLMVRDRLVGVRVIPPEDPENPGHGMTDHLIPPEGVEVAPPRVEVSTGQTRHDFTIVPHPSVEPVKVKDLFVDQDSHYVAMKVDGLDHLPPTIEHDGETFHRVTDQHVTVFTGDRLRDDLVAEHGPDEANAKLNAVVEAAKTIPMTAAVRNPEMHLAERDGRKSLVVPVRIGGFNAFMKRANEAIGSEVPRPRGHITLYTTGDRGIGLTNPVEWADTEPTGKRIWGDPIEDDARRRDFTANALYQDEDDDKLIDPLGGAPDVQAGKLRVISEESFREDPLRMLRGIRFKSQHGLEPDEETLVQMRAAAPSLDVMTEKGVSGTAVKELNKLLMGDHVADALRTARDTGVLTSFLPELKSMIGFDQESKYHDLTADEHTFLVLDHLAKMNAPLAVRLAALGHDSRKRESAHRGKDGRLHFYGSEEHGTVDHAVLGAENLDAMLTRLNYPGPIKDRAVRIARHHMVPVMGTKRPAKLRRWRGEVGNDLVDDVLLHRRADLMSKGKDDDDLATVELDRLIERLAEVRDDPTGRADLAISGKDLVAAGVPQGPMVGQMLDSLLNSVIADPSLNQRDWLLDQVAKRMRVEMHNVQEAALLEAPDWREAAHPRNRLGRFRLIPRTPEDIVAQRRMAYERQAALRNWPVDREVESALSKPRAGDEQYDDPELLDALESAQASNVEHLGADLIAFFGEVPIILREHLGEGFFSAVANADGYYSAAALRKREVINGEELPSIMDGKGPPRPPKYEVIEKHPVSGQRVKVPVAHGVASNADIASVIRHEWFHHVEGMLTDEQRREYRSLFPRKEGGAIDDWRIAEEVTPNAGANQVECAAEVFAITTHPRFKPDEWPEWVSQAGWAMTELLYSLAEGER